MILKERYVGKVTSGGATRELLPDKQTSCTLLLVSKLSVDNYSDDWRNLILLPVTTCNVISSIEQAPDVPANDVVLVSSTQSDSLHGDVLLTSIASPAAQLTGLCKTRKVEILNDTINQVVEDLHTPSIPCATCQ